MDEGRLSRKYVTDLSESTVFGDHLKSIIHRYNAIIGYMRLIGFNDVKVLKELRGILNTDSDKFKKYINDTELYEILVSLLKEHSSNITLMTHLLGCFNDLILIGNRKIDLEVFSFVFRVFVDYVRADKSYDPEFISNFFYLATEYTDEGNIVLFDESFFDCVVVMFDRVSQVRDAIISFLTKFILYLEYQPPIGALKVVVMLLKCKSESLRPSKAKLLYIMKERNIISIMDFAYLFFDLLQLDDIVTLTYVLKTYSILDEKDIEICYWKQTYDFIIQVVEIFTDDISISTKVLNIFSRMLQLRPNQFFEIYMRDNLVLNFIVFNILDGQVRTKVAGISVIGFLLARFEEHMFYLLNQNSTIVFAIISFLDSMISSPSECDGYINLLHGLSVFEVYSEATHDLLRDAGVVQVLENHEVFRCEPIVQELLSRYN